VKRKISGIFIVVGKGYIFHLILSPTMTQTFLHHPEVWIQNVIQKLRSMEQFGRNWKADLEVDHLEVNPHNIQRHWSYWLLKKNCDDR